MTDPQSVDEGKVDVLAVMKDVMDVLELESFLNWSARLEKARSAVADLIAADIALDKAGRDWAQVPPSLRDEATAAISDAYIRRQTSLARIGATP